MSDTVICFSRRTSLTQVIPILDVLSERGVNYTVFLREDWRLKETQGTLILLEDPGEPFELKGRNLVIVINTRGQGFFTKYYGELKSRKVKVSAVFWRGRNITLSKPAFVYPILFPSASTLAWYVSSNGTVLGVCVCSLVINKTTVYYVDARPLLNDQSALKALLNLLLDECNLNHRAKLTESQWILTSKASFEGDVEAYLEGGVLLNVKLDIIRAKRIILKASKLEVRRGLLNYVILVVWKPCLIVEDGEVIYRGYFFNGSRITLLLNKTVILYSRYPLIECEGVAIFYEYINAGFKEVAYGVSFRRVKNSVRLTGSISAKIAYASDYIFFNILDYHGVLTLPYRLTLGFESFKAMSEFIAFLIFFSAIEIGEKVFIKRKF